MAILSRDQIRQKQDLQTEVLPVPEWDGEVIVRGLSAAQRLEVSAKLAEFKDQDLEQIDPAKMLKLLQVQAEVVCCSVVDEQGNYLFDNKTDVEWLVNKSPKALESVFTTAMCLSGIDPKAVEEAAKNS